MKFVNRKPELKLLNDEYNKKSSALNVIYGRRTSQINLKQISFKYYSEFFNDISIEKLIEFYAITGGIP